MRTSSGSNQSSPPLPAYSEILAEIARREALRAHADDVRNAEAIRARCHTLAGFVREAWRVLEPNARYVHSWHIDAICSHLEAVTSGRITRLPINVPPGSMKSLLVSVFLAGVGVGAEGNAVDAFPLDGVQRRSGQERHAQVS